jgi:glycosyltransferase involved in cell wall biosynthesis
MKLIIQIPAYNEETTIAQTLRDIPKRVDGFSSVETLVVDDGSSDRTSDAARKAGATHVVQLRNHRGLSAAFIAGIDASLRFGADVIVNTDADNQYAGADIPKLVAPIVRGTAEVVIGDREVGNSPHMSGFKRMLQRLGSWTVGLASGVNVSDVTSGFRAFSRDAAMQINVFNPFTYTLETIIQAGNRNLGVQTVTVRTNAPTRPSRLYNGIGTYLRKSIATIFRVYTTYRPLKTFFAIGSALMFAGLALGGRFLWYFAQGGQNRGGHIQSLILAAVFLIVGFQTWLMALIADLIGVNRRLSEEVLIRVKKLEAPAVQRPAARPQERERDRGPRPQRRDAPQRAAVPRPATAAPSTAAPVSAAPAAPPSTQWVWLLDEDKLAKRSELPEEMDAEEETEDEAIDAVPATEGKPSSSRRRRRRRGGARPSAELPGNRGKHLTDEAGNE